MSSAGQKLIAGRIPGEEVAIDDGDSDVTFTTTETACISVVAPLVTGRTYRVWFAARWSSTVANDDINVAIREDSTTGTRLQIGQIHIPDTDAFGHGPYLLVGRYTAASTGNKTFVGTGVRGDGSGTCRMDAQSDGPAYIWVEYVSG